MVCHLLSFAKVGQCSHVAFQAFLDVLFATHLPRQLIHKNTVYVAIFAVVLFSQISRVRTSWKFPLQYLSIYSTNKNIRKITKLSPHEFPHLVQNCENICTRNVWRIQQLICIFCPFRKLSRPELCNLDKNCWILNNTKFWATGVNIGKMWPMAVFSQKARIVAFLGFPWQTIWQSALAQNVIIWISLAHVHI